MRFLNGADLSDYIKERQARQVRGLRQAHHVFPRLVIILAGDNPASLKYIELKKRYAEDILIDVVVERGSTEEMLAAIARHNADPLTHGIIVQLPLPDIDRTDEVLAAVTPEKDVDGLHSTEFFDPATPTAILWLLAGYNIELKTRRVMIIGKGRLVGAPLLAMLEASGIDVAAVERGADLTEACKGADVIITATGQPGLLTNEMIPQGCVVVDAGVASEGGVLVGDIAADVYETRQDLTLTPKKGGVGPLTVCALFDNVIRAARRVAQAQAD